MENIEIKRQFPKIKDYLKLFQSVGWTREVKKVKNIKKHTTYCVCLYKNKECIAMGRVVSDKTYYTIYDFVVKKEEQNKSYGTLVLKEIINWYKRVKDDDSYLYLGASKNTEKFYEKFGFKSRPNEEVGAGMIWYEE